MMIMTRDKTHTLHNNTRALVSVAEARQSLSSNTELSLSLLGVASARVHSNRK